MWRRWWRTISNDVLWHVDYLMVNLTRCRGSCCKTVQCMIECVVFVASWIELFVVLNFCWIFLRLFLVYVDLIFCHLISHIYQLTHILQHSFLYGLTFSLKLPNISQILTMTSIRPFQMNDFLRFNNVNLDTLTETVTQQYNTTLVWLLNKVTICIWTRQFTWQHVQTLIELFHVLLVWLWLLTVGLFPRHDH